MNSAQNLAAVHRRIKEAALRADRDPSGVKLLAVTKTMPPEVIMEAYGAGQKYFAENRVQEWQGKSAQIPVDCEWHLIGRLQTNKVKYLNDRISLIHSLDRYELLRELEKQGASKRHIWTTLIQVNIANDPAKAGLEINEVKDFLAAVADCRYVRVAGLMTIGRLDAGIKDTRMYFRELRYWRDIWQKHAPAGVDLRELSMGMSQDFEIAVEEGASIVRVGREIFGERQ
jgi:pyridoxal phosphate enzyme (YggS family)